LGRCRLRKPEIYEALEGRAAKYAIRIPVNESLERDIAELLTRRWVVKVEFRIKEGKQAVKMTRLTCRFRSDWTSLTWAGRPSLR